MNRRSNLPTGFALFFCLGLFAFACGGDGTPPNTRKLDAGRGGSGGSSAKGGSGGGGSGGSNATGGSRATGGSGGSGGASAPGGSGGATATGGSTSQNGGAGGGTTTGGSGGSAGTGGGGGTTTTGGTTATGGTTGSDGGARDGAGSDAIDAPSTSDDTAAVDAGGPDGGVPLVDAQGQDAEEMDGGADATAVLLDAETDRADSTPDLPEPDLAPDLQSDAPPDLGPEIEPDVAPDIGPDLGPDLPPNPVPCSSVPIVSSNSGGSSQTYQPGLGTSFCFATCDDIAGWQCGQAAGRQVYLDGQLIANCSSNPPVPAKVAGGYHIFQLSAGSDPSAFITWWMSSPSSGASCLAPDGGFGLN